MTLTPYSEPAPTPVRWAQVMVPAMELAQAIAETDFVPKALRGNPGAIAACILYGDELAIGPMQALRSIDVIEGRPTPSAALIRALILRDGHSFVLHEATGTRCTVSGLRAGRPEAERTRVTWDLDMARSAGLLGKGVWQRYPRAMLVARASSELGNQVFPDVMKGLGLVAEDSATAAEVATWSEDTSAPEPPRKRVARKRASKSIAAPEQLPRKMAHLDTEDTPLPPELQPHEKAPEEPWGAQNGTEAQPPTAPPPEPPAGSEPPATSPAGAADDWPPMPPERAPKPPTPKPMGEGLRRAYMASWKGAGIDPDADRQMRLAVSSLIAERPITSSSELTHLEALAIVGTLAEVETGAQAIVADADGAPKLVSLKEPPLDEES